QLSAEGAALCQQCHESVKKFLARANIHPAVQMLGCQGCHDPHASDVPFQLKFKEVCVTCHPANP
ncbi:MAG: cytochrome C, partial [Anaerolineae bacterium]|nr:cytochrome C [Anaerolineae bacterium]